MTPIDHISSQLDRGVRVLAGRVLAGVGLIAAGVRLEPFLFNWFGTQFTRADRVLA
jgi:hypothetical protein